MRGGLLVYIAQGETMKRILFTTLAILCCSATLAGPAPWYKWHSAEGEHDVCAQFSPGEGWVIVKGPFEDSSCRKQGVPH